MKNLSLTIALFACLSAAHAQKASNQPIKSTSETSTDTIASTPLQEAPEATVAAFLDPFSSNTDLNRPITKLDHADVINDRTEQSAPPAKKLAVASKELSATSKNTQEKKVSTEKFSTNSKSRLSEFIQSGAASWYGNPFHGRKTASGAVFDMFKMTAAHKTLPLNSRVKVTNTSNNKSIMVLVNDRGPYVSGRILDLSYAAAKFLGISGVGHVKIERID